MAEYFLDSLRFPQVCQIQNKVNSVWVIIIMLGFYFARYVYLEQIIILDGKIKDKIRC